MDDRVQINTLEYWFSDRERARQLALSLLDWHGGGNTATYAVGSTLLAWAAGGNYLPHTIPLRTLQDCASELYPYRENFLDWDTLAQWHDDVQPDYS